MFGLCGLLGCCLVSPFSASRLDGGAFLRRLTYASQAESAEFSVNQEEEDG
jgi:hypothetical protein